MKYKKVFLASSSQGYRLVIVNGLTVARVKQFEDISEDAMNDEQKLEWHKVNRLDLDLLREQFLDFDRRHI